MNKKIWVTGLLAILLVTAAGCGQKPTAAPSNSGSKSDTVQGQSRAALSNGAGSNTESQKTEVNNTVKDNANKTQKAIIKVYYNDDQATKLVEAQKEISFESDIQKYEAALKALQTSDDPKLFPLWPKVIFKSVKIHNGDLTIDLTLPDAARLGSEEEQFALDSLKKTLFQFEEVKTIDILVDGKQVDSLMGHVDLDHPMKRDSSQ
ncbi:GerMN domain-containing protein [Paenibacillus sediminis]|uniref:Spore germination protein GerM n=1 Tax=Paenibacillus sediminis TaxID=664909 RepID=A0ABS4GZY6_9BACL|nr:GerMN domain-containing protein [Paenibacillus sediminis]MBP1935833.1 spore germination protein GerM [Paenibacillus sediminis]